MKQFVIISSTIIFLSCVLSCLQGMQQSTCSPLVQALLDRNYHYACDLIKIPKTNVNEIDWQTGGSILMLACYAGLYDVAHELLARNDILINIVDNSGSTALTYAVQGGHVGIIWLLLAQQDIDKEQAHVLVNLIETDTTINVNATNSKNYSLLMAFCSVGWCEVVEALLKKPSILINAQDSFGSTALMYAIRMNQVEVIKALLAHSQIDISIQDKNGFAALYWAEQCRDSEIIDLIKTADEAKKSWSYCVVS